MLFTILWVKKGQNKGVVNITNDTGLDEEFFHGFNYYEGHILDMVEVLISY